MKPATILILFAIVTLVVSACSSAAAEPTATSVPIAPTVTATIESSGVAAARESLFYLNSIENNAVQVTAAFARIEEQLSKVWPTKSSLIDAFDDSNLSQEIISSLGAIVQLSPPDEFEQEHRILQTTANTVVEYIREFEQALQDRDLTQVMIAKANFVVSYKRMLMKMSPAMCNSLGIANDSEILCDVRAGAPGTYDADVEQLFKEFRLEFLPRVTSFPVAMTEEERFSALAALNKDIEVATRNAADTLAGLSPTPDRVDDHQVLLKFLRETSDTASAITVAGSDRDGDEIQRLFTQSTIIVESAGATISCEYGEILLHGFFRTCVP